MNPPTPSANPRSVPHAPPIDTASLLERCMNNAEIALLVLDKLEEQITRDLDALTVATAADDFDALTRTAHALKGAASSAGASALSRAAGCVESLAKADHADHHVLDRELHTLQRLANACANAIPGARHAIQHPRT